MNRRTFIGTITAAPVVLGITATARPLAPQFGGGVLVADTRLSQLAERIRQRVEAIELPPSLSLDGVETIIHEEMTAAHLANMNNMVDDRTIEFLEKRAGRTYVGRYRVLRAVDEDTFLPVVGVQMWPSLRGYQNGLTFRASIRTEPMQFEVTRGEVKDHRRQQRRNS